MGNKGNVGIGNGIIAGLVWWGCAYWFGFWNTLIWSIVFTALIALYIRLSETNNNNVY